MADPRDVWLALPAPRNKGEESEQLKILAHAFWTFCGTICGVSDHVLIEEHVARLRRCSDEVLIGHAHPYASTASVVSSQYNFYLAVGLVLKERAGIA